MFKTVFVLAAGDDPNAPALERALECVADDGEIVVLAVAYEPLLEGYLGNKAIYEKLRRRVVAERLERAEALARAVDSRGVRGSAKAVWSHPMHAAVAAEVDARGVDLVVAAPELSPGRRRRRTRPLARRLASRHGVPRAAAASAERRTCAVPPRRRGCRSDPRARETRGARSRHLALRSSGPVACRCGPGGRSLLRARRVFRRRLDAPGAARPATGRRAPRGRARFVHCSGRRRGGGTARARHYCHAPADEYAAGARSSGHVVRFVDVGRLEFPLLRTKEAFERSDVPAELSAAQRDIAWADHLLLVYPLWLGEMPALIKGLFELLRPGFAFEVDARGWEPKLRGKTARVVVTMGMPAAFHRWYFGAHSLKSLRRNILSFVGIKPVRTTLIGQVEGKNPKRRHAGSRGCTRWARPPPEPTFGKYDCSAPPRPSTVSRSR